jgi:hypothetical protein
VVKPFLTAVKPFSAPASPPRGPVLYTDAGRCKDARGESGTVLFLTIRTFLPRPTFDHLPLHFDHFDRRGIAASEAAAPIRPSWTPFHFLKPVLTSLDLFFRLPRGGNQYLNSI